MSIRWKFRDLRNLKFKGGQMVISDRLRELREEKKLSQGDIEKRTGLLRCYISRVENGHTVPAIETLEKLARAGDQSGVVHRWRLMLQHLRMHQIARMNL